MAKYQPQQPFTQNDWNHLHDCWVNVKGVKPTQEQLEALFQELPSDLQHLADEWGMNDTVFREEVMEWILSNHFTEE
jgi:hypothetical protein